MAGFAPCDRSLQKAYYERLWRKFSLRCLDSMILGHSTEIDHALKFLETLPIERFHVTSKFLRFFHWMVFDLLCDSENDLLIVNIIGT